MLGHRFYCIVLVGAKNNALPIPQKKPWMMANFGDDEFGHSGPGEQIHLRTAALLLFFNHNPPRSTRPSAWSRVLNRAVAGNTCDGFLQESRWIIRLSRMTALR